MSAVITGRMLVLGAIVVLAACGADAPAATSTEMVSGPSASPVGTASPAPSPTATATATPALAAPGTQATPLPAPETWTPVHTIGDGSTRTVGADIAHGSAGFLAISKTFDDAWDVGPRLVAQSVWRSVDGVEWAGLPYPSPEEGTYVLQALSGAADGSYVIHALHQVPDVPDASTVSLRSTDGVSWEPLATGLPQTLLIQAIEEGPNGYLLVGGQSTQSNPTLWLSPDGLTWELVHEFSQDDHFVQLTDGDGGAEGYVVVGRRIQPDNSYQRFSFASADGLQWFESTSPFGPDDQSFVPDVAISSYGGDWLATLRLPDDTVSLWWSANGLNWSPAGSLAGPALNVITAGLFEEVGDELVLAPGASVWNEGTPGTWSSTDGLTWSPVDLGADAWVGELAIGNGIAAMTGTIDENTDGLTSIGVIWIRTTD